MAAGMTELLSSLPENSEYRPRILHDYSGLLRMIRNYRNISVKQCWNGDWLKMNIRIMNIFPGRSMCAKEDASREFISSLLRMLCPQHRVSAHLDGFISYPTAVYTVPLGVILPRNVENLLLPVPVSGSHLGFSTLRMEPCWMALGQAAGIAASLAIDCKVPVQDVDMSRLQDLLVDQKATLIYFRDLRPEDSNFRLAQYMGLRGYLPEWNANLYGAIDEGTLQEWSALCGFKPKVTLGKTSRLEVLTMIYKRLRQ